MKKLENKYSYATPTIIRIGIVCSLVVFSLQLFLIDVFKPSDQTIYFNQKSFEFIVWKILGINMSFGFAVWWVRYTIEDLKRIVPAWLLVFGLGFIAAVVSVFIYSGIEVYFEHRNCSLSSLNFDACRALSNLQIMIATVITSMLNFAIVGLMFGITQKLGKLISNKRHFR